MMQLERILLPTDFSERSKRALVYCLSLANENKATLTVLHVANSFTAWELQSDEFGFISPLDRTWPADRVISEASLELSHFLEPFMETIKRLRAVSKQVVLGAIAEEIALAAEELNADLVVMSPRRHRGLSKFFRGSITDRVTRISPCPVLCVMEPLPSRPWQGKLAPNFLGWPRQKLANI
jgi:nucleotide-binding universal stress UspA family protein